MANPPESNVSSDFPFTFQTIAVLDSKIAYIDTRDTRHITTTAIFLHGNPTSSYIWRNIIPHVGLKLRCIAPDLIGMGKSGKPDIAYRFVDHARYLDAFLDAVVPEGKMVFVIQDWGSALGFHWARRHQERVSGIAFMEFIRPFATWDDAGERGPGQETFKAFRTPGVGRKLLVEDNLFIKAILPGGVVRGLAPEEQVYYEAPYLDEKSREPVYRWPNELPIEGSPEDVYAIAEEYHEWLLGSAVPKLLFWASPGVFVRDEQAKWYVEKLKNLKAVFLGEGLHYLQEDHPHRIGSEIAEFIDMLDSRVGSN
ncbi:putative hydrolase [Mytilinidion resinicola]|uniref:haloalkane dehalogenase n=1 Tax=Mytilinidion resinicola TaxID=574789 RepID=A0A6A6YV14_9PEZI|nr:putative hydrolase [Mytilinidion resinicola]KAF2812621.1 putative hydrolase [Mytilinidion resinicola]